MERNKLIIITWDALRRIVCWRSADELFTSILASSVLEDILRWPPVPGSESVPRRISMVWLSEDTEDGAILDG